MKIGIIGGAGRMGQCFSALLARENFEICVSDKNEEEARKIEEELGFRWVKSNAELAKESDIILISLPLNRLEEAVVEIAPFIRNEQIVVDISSIKKASIKTMHKYLGRATTLGVHPMFGPETKDFSHENFVLVPTNQKEKRIAEKIEDYLIKKGANVVFLSPKEHDNSMSMVLGFPHFVGVTIAEVLFKTDIKKLKEASGPSFEILLELVENVIFQDPCFYANLQMQLPGLEQVENDFFDQVKKWKGLIKSKDKESFVKNMKILSKKIEKLH